MFDYTLTIFNKEYKVSALTFWTVVAVSVVAMVVSIVMAVEGLCKNQRLVAAGLDSAQRVPGI